METKVSERSNTSNSNNVKYCLGLIEIFLSKVVSCSNLGPCSSNPGVNSEDSSVGNAHELEDVQEVTQQVIYDMVTGATSDTNTSAQIRLSSLPPPN